MKKRMTRLWIDIRRHRRFFLWILDLFLFCLALVLALALRFDFVIPREFLAHIEVVLLVTALSMTLTFRLAGLFNSLWEFASVDELISIGAAAVTGSAITFGALQLLGIPFPRSCYILLAILVMALNGGVRFAYRALRRSRKYRSLPEMSGRRVLIFGGGEAGAMVIREMKQNPQIGKFPVAILDDDPGKMNRRISGVPIVGTREHLNEALVDYAVDEIVIAIPTAPARTIREIVNLCKETRKSLLILPGIYELLDGQVSIKKLRDVNLEDLLGREPVESDLEGISRYVTGRVVLVTGAGGSIGSELCRQIARFSPSVLLMLDIYENSLYDIANELAYRYPDLPREVLIASIRDETRMESVFRQWKPSIVFHAAAHKHVPLMEHNPWEAIKNNVLGTRHVAMLADRYGADKFIMISTDKAVNPTNVMGASKRMAEMVVQTLNAVSRTEYVAVRFGNVLGSNGSVIPLFREQIRKGGPVTVTHPDIIRYFMTIPEAVSLVIQAGALARGGEVFVLDMGEPVRIVQLAEDLIKLSGLVPYEDIEIVFTGLRPGEKLFEELLLDGENVEETPHRKIFIGKPEVLTMEELEAALERLRTVLDRDPEELRQVLREVVPTYRPETFSS